MSTLRPFLGLLLISCWACGDGSTSSTPLTRPESVVVDRQEYRVVVDASPSLSDAVVRAALGSLDGSYIVEQVQRQRAAAADGQLAEVVLKLTPAVAEEGHIPTNNQRLFDGRLSCERPCNQVACFTPCR